ncbi:hypothetical protein EUX98_g9413 [Antrodiella citrinella]|uniref:Tyr recombinase domain-containing protein n=1 Tax=Antrodiella citrinella TaxID=2447956 RepID=A0A4S4LVP4_9APHY|nr:hypothetical protein EUX98_g9413 [Antrodiella citrinella]
MVVRTSVDLAVVQDPVAAAEAAVHAISEADIDNEEILLDLEEAAGYEENLDKIMEDCMDDFVDEDDSPAAQYAAVMARACITEGTRNRHTRIIKAYIMFQRRADPSWNPKGVLRRTPFDICRFITQKCGDKSQGFEGRKFSTAIATRAALTLWYRCVRQNERTDEWRQDVCDPDVWHGLPTRSREVSKFMIGLEKTMASAGKISQSVRALTLEDMHRLYDHCFRAGQSDLEARRSVMRYCAYCLAFLMMLRVNEVVNITFEGVENIPYDRDHVSIMLGPRKTSQTKTHTFPLHAHDDDPRLCPKRMFLLLATLYGEDFEPSGPLFRYINNYGHAERNKPLTTGVLHRGLMTDLQALGYTSWPMYGTHSFRRGGCQYRVKVKNWSTDMVAAWGGWSQVEAITMFRYFYSPNDNHEYMAEYDRNYPKRVCIRKEG